MFAEQGGQPIAVEPVNNETRRDEPRFFGPLSPHPLEDSQFSAGVLTIGYATVRALSLAEMIPVPGGFVDRTGRSGL
jgi:hypothetical protein